MKKILIFAGVMITLTALFANSNKCNSQTTIEMGIDAATTLSEDSDLMAPDWDVTVNKSERIITCTHGGTKRCYIYDYL